MSKYMETNNLLRPDPNKGFTLLELIIVIIIVGVLAGLALPKMFGAMDCAKAMAMAQKISSLRNEMEKCALFNNQDYSLCGISWFASTDPKVCYIAFPDFEDNNYFIMYLYDNTGDPSCGVPDYNQAGVDGSVMFRSDTNGDYKVYSRGKYSQCYLNPADDPLARP